jgi:NAD(P) transhydrogenase subunit beta
VSDAIIALWYLIAATLFILGLQRLASPATARRGNALSSAGMLIAVLAALADHSILSAGVIWTAALLGAAAGLWLARWSGVALVRVPRIVALLNGCGGGAALFVACDEYMRIVHTGAPAPLRVLLPLQVAVLLGGVTLAAGVVAWARLEGRVPNRPLTYRFERFGNPVLAALLVALLAYLTKSPDHPWWLALAVIMTVQLGVLTVIRVETADLGNVIALLNAGAALAAGAIGFALELHGLVLAAGLAGASSVTLARLAARDAGRPLANVLRRVVVTPPQPATPTATPTGSV